MESTEIDHPQPSFGDEKYDPETPNKETFDETRLAEVAGAYFDDPNLDRDHIHLEDDSPYPEVRSAVANTDDVNMPADTIRAWVLGFIWAIIVPGLNQFFYLRFPSVTIGNLVAQLLSYPMGRAWAMIVPDWKIFGISLNPGPFSVKEHVLITIMAGVGANSAYATDIVVVQRVFYNQIYNFSCGVARRFLVSPPSMSTRGGISRERFFLYVFVGSTLWYFLPGYLFTALSLFSWVCWIAPDNVTVNQLFGYQSGLGMSLITFDTSHSWSQIAYIGSPLATPWWAEANVMVGFVAFFWIIAPAWYFTNTMYQSHLPLLSLTSYDNMGEKYNVTAIINEDLTLNLEKYEAYSPLFLSSTFALSYGLSFAGMTSTLVHTLLYFRKQIMVQARRSLGEQPDIHARLMSRYRQHWLVIFKQWQPSSDVQKLNVLPSEVWPTQLPVWAFCLALCISFVYIIPIGMIQAITNQQIGLNVITELIIGYALPGKPVAMMMFKTWGYITMTQALQFTSDFKLGHYMKVLATIVAGTVQLGVQSWMFTNIPNICSTAPPQKDGFICPNAQVFGAASIIWGVIGPARQFSKGQIYYPLTFFFLAGTILPIIPYLITRKYPSSVFKYLKYENSYHNYPCYIPPATAVNYVPWAIVGFIFQYVIRRRHFSWWTKYNYILSAALDSGVAIGIVLVFFCLQYPKNGTIGATTVGTWWGNNVYLQTADALKTPRIQNDPDRQNGSVLMDGLCGHCHTM
ncbi:OPT oligopeptide transporter [Hysterangium stoloniferum]|nr:OPT oligopeptide transporter [Hysterangium stoloniferum]